MIEIKLKMNGSDELHVEVENGIEFTGTVTICQMSGKRFWIDGILKGEADDRN